MATVKLTTVGNSVGIVLPRELLAKLQVPAAINPAKRRALSRSRRGRQRSQGDQRP